MCLREGGEGDRHVLVPFVVKSFWVCPGLFFSGLAVFTGRQAEGGGGRAATVRARPGITA